MRNEALNRATIPAQNLILHSEDLSLWTVIQANVTVTPGQAGAPNNTASASLVDVTAASANTGLYIQATGVAGALGHQNTKSIWLKGVLGGEVVQLIDPNVSIASVNCNLTTSWQRFSFTDAAGAQPTSVGLWIRKISGNQFYGWGGQIVRANWAGDYVKTTTSAVSQGTNPRNQVSNRKAVSNRASAAGTTQTYLGASFLADPSLFTLSGANITAAADMVGGSNVLASSSNYCQTDATGAYGATTTSIRTSNTLSRFFSSTGGVTKNAPFHFIWIGKVFGVGSNGDYESFISLGAPSAVQNFGLSVTSTGQITAICDDGAVVQNVYVPNGATPTFALDNDHDHIVEVQYDGSSLSFWVNGKRASSSDVTVKLNISDASFGVQSWQTASARYPIHDSRIDSFMLKTGTVLQRRFVNEFLRIEMRRLGGTGKITQFFGDSTTSGGAGGTTAANYVPMAVRSKNAGKVVVYPQNCGHSGWTSTQIYTSEILTNTDPATHAVVWMGVNDIAGSVAAATIYANVTSAVNTLHARGIKVVVATIQQWGALVSDPTDDAIRVAYNALIIANAAGADAIADVSTAMGAYNAANFCADTLHPNDTANSTIIAPCIYGALSNI